MTTPTPASPNAPASGMPGWVKGLLLGCGGLVLLCALVMGGCTWFVMRKARQAGLDPDLMKKNPALAAAKMAVALNPDVEVVKVDDAAGLLTVRDKKTGKVVTVNLEDAKKGRFAFQEEGKPPVTLETQGDGATGSMEIKSQEGTVTLGGGGKAPQWIPAYPGAAPQSTFASHTDQGEAGSFHFATPDSVDKVAGWYAAELKKAGMKVTSNTMTQDGKTTAGFATGEAAGGKRKVSVAATLDGSATNVAITYEAKK